MLVEHQNRKTTETSKLGGNHSNVSKDNKSWINKRSPTYSENTHGITNKTTRVKKKDKLQKRYIRCFRLQEKLEVTGSLALLCYIV
jgi:hypothetical protein